MKKNRLQNDRGIRKYRLGKDRENGEKRPCITHVSKTSAFLAASTGDRNDAKENGRNEPLRLVPLDFQLASSTLARLCLQYKNIVKCQFKLLKGEIKIKTTKNNKGKSVCTASVKTLLNLRNLQLPTERIFFFLITSRGEWSRTNERMQQSNFTLKIL